VALVEFVNVIRPNLMFNSRKKVIDTASMTIALTVAFRISDKPNTPFSLMARLSDMIRELPSRPTFH
jgi:hypothetical protein